MKSSPTNGFGGTGSDIFFLCFRSVAGRTATAADDALHGGM